METMASALIELKETNGVDLASERGKLTLFIIFTLVQFRHSILPRSILLKQNFNSNVAKSTLSRIWFSDAGKSETCWLYWYVVLIDFGQQFIL